MSLGFSNEMFTDDFTDDWLAYLKEICFDINLTQSAW